MALLNKNRSRLLMGAGPMALAVSLTLAPERASAQAFQATETVADGIVTRNLTGTGTETIVVETDTAIVDWTPTEDGSGNALDFLPTGNTATFENGVNVTDFAILNRILPATNGNITVFDGTVISQLRDALGGVSPGGTVVFYSPTGILVGANATFDVGNLIMTTLDPSATFNTWAGGGQTGQLDLVGTPSTTAQIIVSPGAQITAMAENSYFALTAAEIQMFGTSSVNGSTAFVAGEQVNLTISNGLFDISIPVGTSVTTPIQIDGDVGGPSSTGIGDNHLIYAVARAAVDPISMIFRGNLGFDPAASAGIVNGEIVLSANYEVNGRSVDGGQTDGGITQLFGADSALTTIAGSVFVEDITATSSLFAIANEEVQVTAFMGNSSIDGNLTMIGRNFSELTSTAGNTFTISGDVLVSASDYSATGDADGGDAFIDAIDGILDIAGNVVVRSNAFVGVDPVFDAAGTGQAGFATIAASGGGSLTIGGTSSVEAFAQGQSSTGQPGNLDGGIAQIFAANGGSIDFQNDVEVSASVLGRGGAQTQGGQAIVQALSGGGLIIDGDLIVAAFTAAFDPLVAGEGGAFEGQGVGGSADIFIEGSESIDISGSVTLAANGSGADVTGFEGGDGIGGQARFLVQNGGVLNIGQNASLQASGFAGSGDSGGDGVGGFAQILLNNGGTVRLDGSLSMTADGTGGLANSAVVGAGGLGDGGNVDIVLDGADDLFVADSALLVADGDGGTSDLGVGGDALGGAARLLITAGGTANIVNDFIARGSATGGNGLGGGSAQGGIAGANAVIGAISIGGNASSSANADGGDATSLVGFGGDGGDALGGNAFLQANGTLTDVASVSIGGNATVLSNATGGDGGQGDGDGIAAGNGGAGTGGVQTIPNQADPNFNSGAFLLAGGDNGTISVAGTALANAVGIGGAGGSGGLDQDGGDGGVGTGGIASAGLLLFGTDGSVAAGIADFAALQVISDGIGGNGGFGGSTLDFQGNGGLGTGGRSFVGVRAGTLTATDVITISNGTGGEGNIGGDGQGGDRSGIFTSAGGTYTIDSFSAFAFGFGGSSLDGIGGNGVGGEAFAGFAGGTAQINGDVIVNASGNGGDSGDGDGGNGTGGTANIGTISADAGSGTITGNAQIIANGFGGQASFGDVGGTGTGGSAFIQAQAGTTATFNTAQVVASGLGGTGSGVTGGQGNGGEAFIASVDDTSEITVTGAPILADAFLDGGALVAANGVGGLTDGGTGVGGAATGGTATIDANAGGTINFPSNGTLGTVSAQAFGGDSAVDGGTGGLGTGGTVQMLITGGTINAPLIDFNALALGGSSNSSTLDIAGGDAVGGTVLFDVQQDGVLAGSISGATAGATGGAGSGTAAGGNASGGLGQFTLSNADLNITGVMVLGTSATGGAGGEGGRATGGMTDFLLTDSNLTFTPDLNGLGGLTIRNETTGGLGTDGLGGDAVSDSVTVDINNSTFANGSIKVSTDAVGGAATGGDSEGGLGLSGAIFFNARASDLDLQDGSVFSAVGTGGAADQGGDGVGRDVFVGIRQSNLDIPVVGQGVGSLLVTSAAVGGQGNQQAGNANSGNASFFSDDGIINIGELTVSAAAFANSTIGGLGGQEAIAGSADVTFDTDSVANIGDLLLLANAINSNDRFARGGRASLFLMDPANASPDVSIQNLELDVDAFGGDDDSPNSIPGEFAIQATAGELTVGTLFGTAQGSELDGERGPSSIEAIGGDIFVTDALVIDTLDDFEIRTGGGSIIGDPSMLDPSLAISLATDGVLRIFGDNDNLISFGGATLTALSRDIEIAAGARIGSVTMTFASTNTDDPGILGGIPGSTGQGPTQVDAGYVLDAAELDRLELTNFSFVQPEVVGNEPNDPDLILRDILVEGEIGDAPGFITVGTDGSGGIMRVEGQVVFDNAPFGTSVSFFANERIEVVTPGGIAVLDSDGLPTGILFLGSNNIWAADDDLIGLLQDDPSFADRNDQLSTASPGSDDPLGYIRGGSVLLGVGESLLVRNTGTEAEPGGILVGDGGLVISSGELGATGPIDVFAYGARADSSGQLITGEAFFNQVNFDNNSTSGSTAYTEESQFNNCVINTGECTITQAPAPAPPPPPTGGEQGEEGEEGEEGEQGENPIEGIGNAGSVNNPAVVEAAIEAVEAAVEAAKNTPANEQEADTEFGVDFPGLLEAPLLTEDPLLEDPVASGGDSSLYSGNEGSPPGDGPSDDGGEE